MVKLHMDGRKAHIEFEGGPKAIAFDVATAISGIYQGMVNNDPEEADMFRYLMQRSLEDGSPVWESRMGSTA